MQSTPDDESVLDDVIRRLTEGDLNWARRRADQFLTRVGARAGAQEDSPSRRNIEFIRLQSGMRRKKKEGTSWQWYAALNTRAPLSNEEHIELANAAEVGLFAEERLAAVGEKGLADLERRELRYLAIRGRRSFEKLLLHNLRLVFHWSRPYREIVAPDEVQDAFQAGVIGLIRGLQGWDHSRGFTLSTYVTSNIRQSIQRWRYNETLQIRIPVHAWPQLADAGVLKRDEGIEDEISAEEISPERTSEQPEEGSVLASAIRAYSIQPLASVSQNIASDEIELATDELQAHYTRNRVESLFDALPERDAGALRMRYGVADGIPKNLQYIGDVFGITRERARQIINKAENYVALLILAQSFNTLEEVIETVGEEAAEEEFWNWLREAFMKPIPFPKGPKDSVAKLRELLTLVPRADTPFA